MQVRWRPVGSTTWSSAGVAPVRYDAVQHFFQTELKASTAKLVKGVTYEVMARVLVLPTDPAPTGAALEAWDLGSRTFQLKVSK
jgi:hypothetical protein